MTLKANPTPRRVILDTATDPDDGFQRAPARWRPEINTKAPSAPPPRADLAAATSRLRLAVHFARRL